jgi:hypothetical protein
MKIRYILLAIATVIIFYNQYQTITSIGRCKEHITSIKAHSEWLKYNGVTAND